MKINRLLLCTDLDRTIIPNGSQLEHPSARDQFRAFCRRTGVCLVYVTGRHLELMEEAIDTYGLPQPAFAITDVGSKIYRAVAGGWQNVPLWEAQIATDWRGKTGEQLEQSLRQIVALTLQEKEKQNRFKLSYYLPLSQDQKQILSRMGDILAGQGVAASLIWSVDEPQQVGLIDVLPENATKLHGLRFLQNQLGYLDNELIFAGDSGNDLPVLVSPVRSVLVANASDEVRQLAVQLSQRNGTTEALYLAEQSGAPLGGNYSAGVLQGVKHFCPEFDLPPVDKGQLP